MSTRSHILFKRTHSWEDRETGEEKGETNRIQFYKHHDGYARATVPQLREFFQYAKARANDLEYFAASFPYWYKRQRERWYRENEYKDMELLENRSEPDDDFEVPKVLTGMGICSEFHIHGDVHHYYVVDLNDLVIEHYNQRSMAGTDDAIEWLKDREPGKTYELDAEPSKGFGDKDE